MSEWENKSNFEINKAVAELRGLKLCEGQHYKPKVSYWDKTCKMFDPCNNPSDSWPIIESFKCAFSSSGAYEPKTGVPYCDDENRLRAAMIVYLETKGVKP